jgi:hypothetical protein
MVTSAVNIESPVTSAENIEGFEEEDKWIVVRGEKNSSKTDYLLKTE